MIDKKTLYLILSPRGREESASHFFYIYAREYIVVPELKSYLSFKGHEYLKQLYRDKHKYMVVQKAGQMGVSTLAIAKAFWACEKKGLNVIYFFPTTTDVRDFSRSRAKPIIIESPHFKTVISKDDIDSTEIRQIGNGLLYFRGMKSTSRMKSVPADFLIFDELDEAEPKAKELARKRIDHSLYRWILEISNPSFPDYGVNQEFKRSDQRHWVLKCPHCQEWNIVEDNFPDCLKRIDKETVILACKKCRLKLDPSRGEWVAKYPGNTQRRGYQISQLYSSRLNMGDLLDEWETTRSKQIYYNMTLGLPYLDAKERVHKSQVIACCRDFERQTSGRRCIMGVDQGDEIHVSILRLELGKVQMIYLAIVREFEELDKLMRDFDIKRCVIDALPNKHSARNFANRFSGRVFLVYYVEDKKGIPKPDYDKKDIEVDRTESLDRSGSMIKSQQIEIYKRDHLVDEFAEHTHNLVVKEVEDEKSGKVRRLYVKLGEDHFRHAFNYGIIALDSLEPEPNVRWL